LLVNRHDARHNPRGHDARARILSTIPAHANLS